MLIDRAYDTPTVAKGVILDDGDGRRFYGAVSYCHLYMSKFFSLVHETHSGLPLGRGTLFGARLLWVDAGFAEHPTAGDVFGDLK